MIAEFCIIPIGGGSHFSARLAKVPVLFYSADAAPKRIEQVMKAGAKEFIVKGTTIGVLLSQVEKYAVRTTGGAGKPEVKPRA